MIHVDFIKFRLAGSSAWRRCLSTKFPDDPRNLLAAKALGRLANDDSEISPVTMAAIKPFVDGPEFVDAVSAVATSVFFRTRPENLDEFLRLVVAKLTEAEVA